LSITSALSQNFIRSAIWQIYAYQSEEENPAGAEAYSIDIQDAQDLLFADTYAYRVSLSVLPADNDRVGLRKIIEINAATKLQLSRQTMFLRVGASAPLRCTGTVSAVAECG